MLDKSVDKTFRDMVVEQINSGKKKFEFMGQLRIDKLKELDFTGLNFGPKTELFEAFVFSRNVTPQ